MQFGARDIRERKAYEAKLHKLKRLVQKPNSFFMDVKCPGCFQM